MNKQEVIKGIKDEKYLGNLDECEEAYNGGLSTALSYVKLLDEPEKPALSKKEAEWVDHLTEFFDTPDALYYITRWGYGYSFNFEMCGKTYELPVDSDATYGELRELKERLVNAVIYGYTVKSKKLYTAKIRLTNEYLHYDKDYKEIRHVRVPDDVAKKGKGYHFTETDLIAYNAWNNNAYDVNEVEE